MRIFSKRAYLIILTTKHVMRTAVTTQMRITMIFKLGRCVSRDDIRDSVVAVEESIFERSSIVDVVVVVEFKCVALCAGRVCGSPAVRHTTAHITVKMMLLDIIMIIMTEKLNDACVKNQRDAFQRVVGARDNPAVTLLIIKE